MKKRASEIFALMLLCCALVSMPAYAAETGTAEDVSVCTDVQEAVAETDAPLEENEKNKEGDQAKDEHVVQVDGENLPEEQANEKPVPAGEELSEAPADVGGKTEENIPAETAPADAVTGNDTVPDEEDLKAETRVEEKTEAPNTEGTEPPEEDPSHKEAEAEEPGKEEYGTSTSEDAGLSLQENGPAGAEETLEKSMETAETEIPAVKEEVPAQQVLDKDDIAAVKVTTAVAGIASAEKKEDKTVKSMSLSVIDYGGQGYGDGQILISNGQRLLIDTYVKESWNNLNKWLRNNSYNEFDIYISHYHDDHMDNVNRILNSGQYKVSTLYLPDPDYMTGSSSYMKNYISMYKGIINNAKQKGVNIIFLKRGSSFSVGYVTANVLWGTDYANNNHNASYINNNSLVTRFTCGNTRYLNAGDIEAATERQILNAKIDVRADILKLNHHGGDTSNTEAFIKAVNPSFCYYNYVGDSSSVYAGDSRSSWAYSSVKTAEKYANVASVRYNGDITYKVYDDVISQELKRNYVEQKVRVYDKKESTNLKGLVINQLNKRSRKYADTTAAGGKYTSSFSLRSGTHIENGWLIGNGRPQYYAKNNVILKGWKKLGSNLYHFNEKTSKVDVGWKTFGKYRFYFFWAGNAAIGPANIGGKKYLFNEYARQVKAGWSTVNGKRYYVDSRTGTLSTGIRNVGGKYYYFKADGSLLSAHGFQKIGKNTYYVCKDSSLKTNWLGVNGNLYYMGRDGAMRSGWQTINGRRCYFNADGSLLSARGFQKIGKATYYVCKDGFMKTGWLGVNGNLYYMGLDGAMRSGWQTINGKRYYFNADGSLLSARGFRKIGGSIYYVCKNGSVKTGWLGVNGNLYYMGPDGAMRTGWQTINGKRYRFSIKGELL